MGKNGRTKVFEPILTAIEREHKRERERNIYIYREREGERV